MAVALGFTGVLLLREPDMGAFMVIALISMGVLFPRRGERPHVPASGAMLVGSLRAGDRPSSPEKDAHLRLPEPGDPEYALGKAYQLTHSLIAFGRGEIFGQAWAAASRSSTGCPRRTPTSCSR